MLNDYKQIDKIIKGNRTISPYNFISIISIYHGQIMKLKLFMGLNNIDTSQFANGAKWKDTGQNN